jgi:hypothetical protein
MALSELVPRQARILQVRKEEKQSPLKDQSSARLEGLPRRMAEGGCEHGRVDIL